MIGARLLVRKDFRDVCDIARKAIHESGFLLLHEIDTTAIMKNAGYTVGPIRQLLFFHPRYMKIIVDKDPDSVIRAPLKIALQSTGNNETLVMFNDPKDIFAGSSGLDDLSEELEQGVCAISTSIERLCAPS